MGIEAHSDGLTLSMGDFTRMTYRAGFLSVRYRQRSPIAQDIGWRLRDDGRVRVDHFQRSSVPNVFAVGDMAKATSGNMTFVATAIASGVTAGAFLGGDSSREVGAARTSPGEVDRLPSTGVGRGCLDDPPETIVRRSWPELRTRHRTRCS